MKDFYQFRESLTEKIVQRTPRGGRFVKSEPKKTTRNVTSNIPKKSAEEKRAEETLEILSYFEDVGEDWEEIIAQTGMYATKHEDDPDGLLITDWTADKWKQIVNGSKNLGKISSKALKAAGLKTRTDMFLLQLRDEEMEDAGISASGNSGHYILSNKNRITSKDPYKVINTIYDIFYLEQNTNGSKIQPKDLKSLTKYY